MKKILIFYTAIGQGHKAIAENIAASLSAAGHTVSLVDALKAQDGKLVRMSGKIHRFMNTQAPWLWKFFYTSELFTNISLGFRTKVASKNYKNILQVVKNFGPDMIICTQTSPSGVVAYLKQQKLYTGLFGIAFSDFHLHRYWLYGEADFYLANIVEQKQEMIRFGISPDKIFITGFNLKPEAKVNFDQVLRKFHVSPGKKVILVSSGSLGLGLKSNLIQRLAGEPDWHTIIVCGTNERARLDMAEHFKLAPNVSVTGFYSPMDELYGMASIFLTKPGGLSVTEALRFNLPMIITSMLPGQEELNLKFLRSFNLVMPEEKDVLAQIRQEFSFGKFREQLESNTAKLSIVGAQKAADCLNDYLAGKGQPETNK